MTEMTEATRQAFIDTANLREWWTNHHNLHTLAEWMKDTHEDGINGENIIDMLEKPWHWTDEFITALEAHAEALHQGLGNAFARAVGASNVTVTHLHVPECDEYVDEDIFRGER